jgi:ankyrin repeat protein
LLFVLGLQLALCSRLFLYTSYLKKSNQSPNITYPNLTDTSSSVSSSTNDYSDVQFSTLPPSNATLATNNNEYALLKAVSENNFIEVKELVKNGVSANIQGGENLIPGDSALILAVKKNNLLMAEYLIKNGANVNTIADQDFPSMDKSALCAAIDNKNEAMVELLLKYKANANEEVDCTLFISDSFSTPKPPRNHPLLSYAIYADASNIIINALITAGTSATVLYGDNSQWSPMLVASINKRNRITSFINLLAVPESDL